MQMYMESLVNYLLWCPRVMMQKYHSPKFCKTGLLISAMCRKDTQKYQQKDTLTLIHTHKIFLSILYSDHYHQQESLSAIKT